MRDVRGMARCSQAIENFNRDVPTNCLAMAVRCSLKRLLLQLSAASRRLSTAGEASTNLHRPSTGACCGSCKTRLSSSTSSEAPASSPSLLVLLDRTTNRRQRNCRRYYLLYAGETISKLMLSPPPPPPLDLRAPVASLSDCSLYQIPPHITHPDITRPEEIMLRTIMSMFRRRVGELSSFNSH